MERMKSSNLFSNPFWVRGRWTCGMKIFMSCLDPAIYPCKRGNRELDARRFAMVSHDDDMLQCVPKAPNPETNTIAHKLNDIPCGIGKACRGMEYKCYKLLQIYIRLFFAPLHILYSQLPYKYVFQIHTSRLNFDTNWHKLCMFQRVPVAQLRKQRDSGVKVNRLNLAWLKNLQR